MANSQCEHTDKLGNRCRGYAKNCSQFCFMHDPASKEARIASATKGGKSKKAIKIEHINLRSFDDYINITEEVLNGVRNGTCSPQKANAINRLLNSFRILLKG
jgi:hypothetical protein